MKQNYCFDNLPMPKCSLLLLLISVFIFYIPISCKRKTSLQSSPTHINIIDSPQVSWNILFSPGSDATARNNVVNTILNYVRNFYAASGYLADFNPVIWCPCDSLLYNISFSAVNGSGGSVVSPPPTKPGPAGSGDYVSMVSIADNIPMFDTNKVDTVEHNTDAIVRNIEADSSKKLAIIDSGIDTTLFTKQIKNLMWTDPFTFTLYNFLPYQPVQDFYDETAEKHGSAVAAVCIKAMEQSLLYPKIMVLKALNQNNTGSIFSVSCALSYAVQKQATLINLSLGYYGQADPILEHYLSLCNSANPSIQVFAAAGNTPGTHNSSDLCDDGTINNKLAAGGRLFYPACFTTEFDNLTSVTQLKHPDEPCIYQNYSNQLISLGIYDKTNCCAFQVGFSTNQPQYFEGSSFATPVASGLKMMSIIKTGSTTASNSIWNSLIEFDPQQKVTIQGKFIKYNPTFP